jgi:hypothetical protein
MQSSCAPASQRVEDAGASSRVARLSSVPSGVLPQRLRQVGTPPMCSSALLGRLGTDGSAAHCAWQSRQSIAQSAAGRAASRPHPRAKPFPWTLAVTEWTVPSFDATSSSVSDEPASRIRATTDIGREAAAHRPGRNVPGNLGRLPLARRSCGVRTLATAVRALVAPSHSPARSGTRIWRVGRPDRPAWFVWARPSPRPCSGWSCSSVGRAVPAGRALIGVPGLAVLTVGARVPVHPRLPVASA